MSAEHLDALAAWAPENEEILGSLAAAAGCPYWWREYVSADGALSSIELPGLDTARRCVWGLLLLAKYYAYEGDAQKALSLLMEVHCLGEHWTLRGTLVEQLRGLAVCGLNYAAVCAVLDDGKPDVEVLRRTLAFFRSRLDKIAVPRFMAVEELYGYDSIQRSFTDDGNGDGRLIPARLYATTSYEEELQEMLEGNYCLMDGFTAIAQCIRLGWRGRATGEALVAVLAVLTYKAWEGRWPQSLEELVEEGVLERVPMDPYSDGPLVYRVTGEGFTLYSAGEDFLDDGGESGEWDQFGTDRVFWPVVQ